MIGEKIYKIKNVWWKVNSKKKKRMFKYWNLIYLKLKKGNFNKIGILCLIC